MTSRPSATARDRAIALRSSVGILWDGPASHVLVRGDDAFDVLDELATSDLFLQTGQARESLLLDEAGDIVLDLVVAREDGRYLVAATGPDPSSLSTTLERARGGRRAETVSLDATHRRVGLHGPYAWELCAAWLGPELVAMPHLSCDERGGIHVLRAGKTGEYGYDVLVPIAETDALRERLDRAAADFDALELDAATLALAALENGFFDARSLPRVRCPLELQLGWRLSSDKPYRGRDAIERRREEGLRRRITWLTGETELRVGDVLLDGAEPVGEIAHALPDPVRGEWLALAVLPLPLAWPGLDLGVASGGRTGAEGHVRTAAPPRLRNRSLFVSPQRHTYAGREHDRFPEIWR